MSNNINKLKACEMAKTFAHPWALVVCGINVYRDLEVLVVLWHLPQPPGSPIQRISRKNLLSDAKGVLHTRVSADQLRSERQRLDPTCEPTKDHIGTCEPVVHELANPLRHYQEILVVVDQYALPP